MAATQRLALIILILLGWLLSACGTSEGTPRTRAGAASPQATAGTPGTAPAVDDVPPTVTVDISVSVSSDVMIAAALEHSRFYNAIVSGEPEVLLTMPGWPQTMHDLGLYIGNWDPTCQRPFYLVILKGDFDATSLVPGRSTERLGQYVAYVFDLTAGVPGDVTFTLLSTNGNAFKYVLQDPSLPDPEFEMAMELAPPYLPCEDVTIPGHTGSPEPESSDVQASLSLRFGVGPAPRLMVRRHH